MAKCGFEKIILTPDYLDLKLVAINIKKDWNRVYESSIKITILLYSCTNFQSAGVIFFSWT
jgi:hypothetical protein